jgi:hypothetical protein
MTSVDMGDGLQFIHAAPFFDTMPTASMSLCMIDCWPRLSHFKVTPDQSVSVTVAWSFLSSRQQTREPTPSDLDSDPVTCRLPLSVSVRQVLDRQGVRHERHLKTYDGRQIRAEAVGKTTRL